MQAEAKEASTWWTVALAVPEPWADDAGASLICGGALGVQVAGEALARSITLPQGQPTAGEALLVATYAGDAEGSALAAQACDSLAELGLRVLPAQVFVQWQQGDDWAHRWKQYFKPMKIGRKLWIVPSWERFVPPIGSITLAVDPGMAFGTGQHPTTAMCLRAIERWAEDATPAKVATTRMLDLGCGTGVLAVAGAKLGVPEVMAVDLDPEAVAATVANAAANEVRIATSVDPVHALPGTFGLIVANILAAPLQELAPAILARLAPGGTLILSGLLTTQADEVLGAYDAALHRARRPGWEEVQRWTQGEWCALGFRTSA